MPNVFGLHLCWLDAKLKILNALYLDIPDKCCYSSENKLVVTAFQL